MDELDVKDRFSFAEYLLDEDPAELQHLYRIDMADDHEIFLTLEVVSEDSRLNLRIFDSEGMLISESAEGAPEQEVFARPKGPELFALVEVNSFDDLMASPGYRLRARSVADEFDPRIAFVRAEKLDAEKGLSHRQALPPGICWCTRRGGKVRME